MNTRGKWLARTGALLIILGFVLPSLTVSCAGVREAGTTFSLAQLASRGEMPLLYLTPLGALALAVLTWLTASDIRRARQYLVAQASSLAACLLAIVISMISLNNQISQLAVFDVTPEFGIVVLIAGFILSGAGLYFQWQEEPSSAPRVGEEWQPNVTFIPEANNEYGEYPPPPPALPAPRLELIAGSAPYSMFPLQQTDLDIGRSRENDIYLPDPKVSRRHARLRYAQGSWFIQDQNSSGGTFVNGVRVHAQRISTGDQITIGDCSFIFRA